MLYQGFIISVVGVTVVFVILGALVLCVKIASLFAKESAPTGDMPPPGTAKAGDKKKISAVIASAILQHKKGKRG